MPHTALILHTFKATERSSTATLQHTNKFTSKILQNPLRNPLQILYTGIAWLWGCCNLAELNRVSRTGLLTVDNEGIKGGTLTENTTFRYNWVPRHG